MTILTVAARLAEIEAGISGVTKAYDLDEIPNAIPNAHLPAIVNFPGPAQHQTQSAGYSYTARDWMIFVYVEPAETPVKFAIRAARSAPFFERFRQKLMTALLLNSLSGVQRAELVSDTGMKPLEWGGTVYTGMMFTVRVVEQELTATDA